LPSVVTVVTGEPLSGSWWSHPLGRTIFQINEQLAGHPDVLTTKLISGKVTFVHRRLWPALFAIGTAREAWQTTGLSPGARRLLRQVDQHGSRRTDQIIFSKSFKPGEAARELEKRLLIHSEELHTESGAHAKLIETWPGWAERSKFQPEEITPNEARAQMEESMKQINERYSARVLLPWQTTRKRN